MSDEFHLRPVPDSPEARRHARQTALDQFAFARHYTLTLLEATPRDRWYEIPANHPASIAWQVGHLCVASYGLLLFRLRGRQPEDLDWIPGKFRKAFGKGSQPRAGSEGQPTPDELLQRLAVIAEHGVSTAMGLDDDALLESIDPPYAAYPNKLGAVLFAPLHEHTHAGQIGVIRRGLGLDPIR